jgi:hypothetical protein
LWAEKLTLRILGEQARSPWRKERHRLHFLKNVLFERLLELAPKTKMENVTEKEYLLRRLLHE